MLRLTIFDRKHEPGIEGIHRKSAGSADLARIASQEIKPLLSLGQLAQYVVTKAEHICLIAARTGTHRFDRRHPAWRAYVSEQNQRSPNSDRMIECG